MAYRYGNRYQIKLLPQSIEDCIASDDPVRAYDAFIEALDFRALGITLDPHKVGNSEYHPHAMWSSPDKTDSQLSDHGHFFVFLRAIIPDRRM